MIKTAGLKETPNEKGRNTGIKRKNSQYKMDIPGSEQNQFHFCIVIVASWSLGRKETNFEKRLKYWSYSIEKEAEFELSHF